MRIFTNDFLFCSKRRIIDSKNGENRKVTNPNKNNNGILKVKKDIPVKDKNIK